MEVPLKDQLGLVKQKQSRIWPKLSLVNVSYLIVQMGWTIRQWENSLRVWHLQELGVALMSLTELIYRFWVLLLNRFYVSKQLKQDMLNLWYLKTHKSDSKIVQIVLLLWILGMQVVHNSQITLKLYFVLLPWWFLIMLWLLRFLCILMDLLMPVVWLAKLSAHINYVLSSFLHKNIMIMVWERWKVS